MNAIVYARVSTAGQDLDPQLAAVKRYCEYREIKVARVYAEKFSGAKATRPEYQKALKDLRTGKYDAVVVFRLDRLGRNARELSLTVEELESRGVKVLSVSENFDTSTAIGRAMREIITIMAELEREQISESTKQRLAEVKRSGKRLGQKPLSPYQVRRVRTLRFGGDGIRAIARQMNISPGSVSNVVHQTGYYAPTPETCEIKGCSTNDVR